MPVGSAQGLLTLVFCSFGRVWNQDGNTWSKHGGGAKTGSLGYALCTSLLPQPQTMWHRVPQASWSYLSVGGSSCQVEHGKSPSTGDRPVVGCAFLRLSLLLRPGDPGSFSCPSLAWLWLIQRLMMAIVCKDVFENGIHEHHVIHPFHAHGSVALCVFRVAQPSPQPVVERFRHPIRKPSSP